MDTSSYCAKKTKKTKDPPRGTKKRLLRSPAGCTPAATYFGCICNKEQAEDKCTTRVVYYRVDRGQGPRGDLKKKIKKKGTD